MLLAYFSGVVLQYDYLSRLRLALTRVQNFYEKPVSLFISIFVESSINVPQIARKNGTEKLSAVIQVCLKLVGACNETVYIPMRKH